MDAYRAAHEQSVMVVGGVAGGWLGGGGGIRKNMYFMQGQ